MADTYTTNLNLTKPEPGAAEDTWGISLNSDLDTLDAIFSSSGTQINLNPNQVNFADNKKAIFGTGSDLSIYHSGTNSHIADTGEGNLYLDATNLIVRNGTGTETYMTAANNGGVVLYHDNTSRFSTTSTGIDVTGTVTSDGLTVDGADVFFNSGWIKSNSSLRIDIDNDNNQTDRAFFISHGNASKDIFKASENGDISFYDDTGSTQGLFWDASTERLGIGNTAPNNTLDVTGNISLSGNVVVPTGKGLKSSGEFLNLESTRYLRYKKTGDSHNMLSIDGTADTITFSTTGSSDVVINNSGSVGIGTNAPSYLLDVESSSTGNITLAQFKTNESTYNGLLIAANNNAGWIGNGTLVADEGILFQDTSSAMRFYTASSERARFDASGNFGIGTTPLFGHKFSVQASTDKNFTVDDNNGTGISLNAYNNSGSNVELAIKSNIFSVHSATAERFRITNAGNVGIGTDSPSAKLDVSASSGSSVQIKNTGTAASLLLAIDSSQNSIYSRGATASTARDLRFIQGSSEAMRIAADGSVGIGTTSPSQKLTVEGNIELGTGGYIYGDTTTPSLRLSNSVGSQLIYGTGILSVAPSFTYSGGGSERFRVTDTGFVGIGTSSPSTTLELSNTSTAPILRLSNENNSITAGADLGVIEFYSGDDSGFGDLVKASISATQPLTSPVNGELVFKTSSSSTSLSEAMRISANGSVGIGTATPNYLLDVEGSGSLLRVNSTSGNNIVQLSVPDTTSITGINFGDSGSTNAGYIWYRHNGDSLAFSTAGTEAIRVDSSQRVGIGTTSPQGNLHVEGAAGASGGGIIYVTDADNGSTASDALQISKSGDTAFIYNRETSGNLQLGAGGNANHMIVRTDGKVGIGITSPSAALNIVNSGLVTQFRISNTVSDATTKYGAIVGSHYTNAEEPITGMLMTSSSSATGGRVSIGGGISSANAVNEILFYTAANNTTLTGSEAGRFDASGNFLVSTTTNPVSSSSVTGLYYEADNYLAVATAGVTSYFNRQGSDGDITHFRKNGTTVGSIGIQSSGLVIDGEVNHTGLRFTSAGITPRLNGAESDNTVDLGESGIRFKDLHLSGTANVGEINIKSGASVVGSIEAATNTNTDISVGSDDIRLLFFTNGSAIIPRAANNGGADNTIDLGGGSNRFQDIYATNGTIQTSDINEKQDIEELSEAETRVAVAVKGLLKKYRWKSAVADKGDDARIHFGIMAQDLQQAFSAEGLDAGDYGMFISSTWTDETTGEEKTRLGVRYNELLAFIIAAI